MVTLLSLDQDDKNHSYSSREDASHQIDHGSSIFGNVESLEGLWCAGISFKSQ